MKLKKHYNHKMIKLAILDGLHDSDNIHVRFYDVRAIENKTVNKRNEVNRHVVGVLEGQKIFDKKRHFLFVCEFVMFGVS